MSLDQESCTACRPDAPRLSAAEAEGLLRDLPGWRLVDRDGIPALERTYAFPDFARALAFTLRVGELAESQGHHPAVLTEWGRVTVTWWTHAIRGLHRNDFVMAARTEGLPRA